MAERKVTQSGKDRDGDITSLCNPGEPWSPRYKQSAISDIESGTHQYFTLSNGVKTYVKVVQGPRGKYLRTDSDSTPRNNLDDLPNC